MSELIVILLVAIPLAALFVAVSRRVRRRTIWTEVDYYTWVWAVRHNYRTITTQTSFMRGNRVRYWVLSRG